MPSKKTDHTWKHYGDSDPYYGVLTQSRFRTDNITEAARQEFFASGISYIEQLVSTIRQTFDDSFFAERALDFGCGVGRLTLPLAQVSNSVVGVDVSPAMLEEARSNARDQGIRNATFVESDDSLSLVTGEFDLIHSLIVFQHIRRSRGEEIVKKMLQLLRPEGIGALHFTYSNSTSTPTMRRLLTTAFERSSSLFGLRNIVKREPFSTPLMQMNMYDLNRLFCLLQEAGCHRVFLRFTEANHFNYPVYGVTIYFQNVRDDVSTHS